jgi:hypothetical protein
MRQSYANVASQTPNSTYDTAPYSIGMGRTRVPLLLTSLIDNQDRISATPLIKKAAAGSYSAGRQRLVTNSVTSGVFATMAPINIFPSASRTVILNWFNGLAAAMTGINYGLKTTITVRIPNTYADLVTIGAWSVTFCHNYIIQPSTYGGGGGNAEIAFTGCSDSNLQFPFVMFRTTVTIAIRADYDVSLIY